MSIDEDSDERKRGESSLGTNHGLSLMLHLSTDYQAMGYHSSSPLVIVQT